MINGMTAGLIESDASAALSETVSLLFEAQPSDVLFWSGAGISGDAPTRAPLGNTLTDRAINEAFDGDLLDSLRYAYSSLGIRRDRPRLEAILEVAAAEHGVRCLALLLDDLRDPAPNGNHHFFARHTLDGGHHVTANFDTCIERAGGDPDRIFHFHGSMSGSGGVQELGARVSGIERGFSRAQRAALDRSLAAAREIVVVGYSGLDYFDVDPYWRDAARRGLVAHRRVIWVNHASEWGVLVGRACIRQQLRTFADLGGAEVYEISAPTRSLLNLMAAKWNIPLIAPPPKAQQRERAPFDADPSARAHATTRFLVTAGLHGAVRRRLAGVQLTVEEHQWAAEAAWVAGRYREAGHHWEVAFAGDDAVSRAKRQEREAACLWLRGRLRAARKLLLQASDEAARHAIDPRLRLLIAETLARVLVHMRRLPDTRLLVTPWWKNRSAALLDEIEHILLEKADGRVLPIHLRARVATARADLISQPIPDTDLEPTRDFNESEALGAMTNYLHASLRRRVEQPRTGDGGPPAPWEYRRLREQFLALGAAGDAARVPLIPGAARAFPLTTVIRDLSRCDFTAYHLARLISGHVVMRIRGR